jgi:6-phosphofructokinase 2
MAQVLTVTLNPALDISSTVDVVRPDMKLRCSTPRIDPGGGGVNVSRAMAKPPKRGGRNHHLRHCR